MHASRHRADGIGRHWLPQCHTSSASSWQRHSTTDGDGCHPYRRDPAINSDGGAAAAGRGQRRSYDMVHQTRPSAVGTSFQATPGPENLRSETGPSESARDGTKSAPLALGAALVTATDTSGSVGSNADSSRYRLLHSRGQS